MNVGFIVNCFFIVKCIPGRFDFISGCLFFTLITCVLQRQSGYCSVDVMSITLLVELHPRCCNTSGVRAGSTCLLSRDPITAIVKSWH